MPHTATATTTCTLLKSVNDLFDGLCYSLPSIYLQPTLMASDKVKLDKDVAKKLDEFRAAAVKASDDVVFRVFPQKIL
ncbi:hypothetical protein A0H81_01478 [Grifola frondosa]|uniref:Uncharacterized protein n=1 Tax=Grifola frondosa TaxID=5627 RepID=A0A1C7MQN1_GRIFR|nr:hypothetical protein A0H81_01478 [Grifola frondosa]